MTSLLKIVLAIFISNTCFSQSPQNGDQLRQDGKLMAAIEAYKEVYKATPKKYKNTYNLACAYALTGQKDSAYYYLEIALKDDTSLWALADPDLYALRQDPRWPQLENGQMERFEEDHGKIEQKAYAKELLGLIARDQALDYYIDQAKAHYMKEGEIPQWYYPIQQYKEQINEGKYDRMEQLLKTHGWPKYSEVGKLAADAPLLIINHHEDDSVRKKYLKQIKQSCLDGEGSCMEYAKIQDRVLVNDNQPQIYGMQFRYNNERKLEPFPVIDPEYVDKRRKEIGLEPLGEYLKRKINYEWIVTQKE